MPGNVHPTTTAQRSVDEWGVDCLDVDAYLIRIGYHGDLSPTMDTMRALHRSHVTTIPFENLDVLLGRPIALDIGRSAMQSTRSTRISPERLAGKHDRQA